MGRLVFLIALAALSFGCSPAEPPATTGDALARAQGMAPADARLAGLYAQSCKACHTIPTSGAPLTGDRTAWAARWAKGMPALLQSTVGGLNGMPPGGQCFACGPVELEALIRFMADQSG